VSSLRLPWVSRTAYELALSQLAAAQERNDRLVEAISQAESKAPVVMPRQPVILEPSDGGWFTHLKRNLVVTNVKEN
jgi:hypothetical protein